MANAGRYKQAVTIEAATETKGAMGGTEKTWYDVFPGNAVRADIIHVSGSDRVAAGQNHSAVVARAFLRYMPGITAKMRLVDDGVIYSITAVIDRTSKRRELELVLSQGVNDG